MQMILPQLPYPVYALEPHISATTLEIHHGKHHRAYVENAKTMAKDVHLADQPLERIIRQTAGKPSQVALYNNAAQAWNHAFYWRSLHPDGGGRPGGALGERIAADLGGYESFVERFAAAASGRFGSGWAWLVLDGDTLKVTSTANADNPLTHGQIPLLTIDVWEHAYYLDYQNRRADHVATVIDNLLNWEFASQNLGRRALATASLHAHAGR